MDWLESLILGVVQGLTEFLPISSDGHLSLAQHAFDALRGGDRGPRETTVRDALLVGLAQAFTPLPGVSRSGLTIATALGLGFSRPWAVGFSLLMAVPAILGAAIFEIKDIDPSSLTSEYVARIVASAAVAGLVGYAAIVWLVRIVGSGRLWYFSVYLIVLGVAVLAIAPGRGEAPDGHRTEPLDRTIRVETPGPGPDEGGG